MHDLGMSAPELAPRIVWQPWLVVACAAIARGASEVALYLFFELPKLTHTRARVAPPVAALVMGVGIGGMHCTGMAAARFAPGSVCSSVDGLDGRGLVGLVVLVTLGLLCVAIVMSAQDVRLQSKIRQARDNRNARKSADMANQATTNFLARMSHALRTPMKHSSGIGSSRSSSPSATGAR